MAILVTLLSIVLILLILRDGFETMLLPRGVRHRFQYVRLFYKLSWKLWRGVALGEGPVQGSRFSR